MRRVRGWGSAGFTLTEVLVTIVLVSILAGVAIPVALSQKKNAVSASVQADLTAAVSGVESQLSAWRGIAPGPGYATLTTTNSTWGLFAYGNGTFTSGTGVTGGTVDTTASVSGTTQANNQITGATFPNGTYIVCAASSDATTKMFFKSTTNAIENGDCPSLTVPLAGSGALPSQTTTGLPAQVTGLTATGGENQIELRWNPVAGTITGYTVVVPGLPPVTVQSTTYKATDVQPGTATVTVRAVNANGAGVGASQTVPVTGPVLQDYTRVRTGPGTSNALTVDGKSSFLGNISSTGALSTLSATIGNNFTVGSTGALTGTNATFSGISSSGASFGTLSSTSGAFTGTLSALSATIGNNFTVGSTGALTGTNATFSENLVINGTTTRLGGDYYKGLKYGGFIFTGKTDYYKTSVITPINDIGLPRENSDFYFSNLDPNECPVNDKAPLCNHWSEALGRWKFEKPIAVVSGGGLSTFDGPMYIRDPARDENGNVSSRGLKMYGGALNSDGWIGVLQPIRSNGSSGSPFYYDGGSNSWISDGNFIAQKGLRVGDRWTGQGGNLTVGGTSAFRGGLVSITRPANDTNTAEVNLQLGGGNGIGGVNVYTGGSDTNYTIAFDPKKHDGLYIYKDDTFYFNTNTGSWTFEGELKVGGPLTVSKPGTTIATGTWAAWCPPNYTVGDCSKGWTGMSGSWKPAKWNNAVRQPGFKKLPDGFCTMHGAVTASTVDKETPGTYGQYKVGIVPNDCVPEKTVKFTTVSNVTTGTGNPTPKLAIITIASRSNKDDNDDWDTGQMTVELVGGTYKDIPLDGFTWEAE